MFRFPAPMRLVVTAILPLWLVGCSSYVLRTDPEVYWVCRGDQRLPQYLSTVNSVYPWAYGARDYYVTPMKPEGTDVNPVIKRGMLVTGDAAYNGSRRAVLRNHLNRLHGTERVRTTFWVLSWDPLVLALDANGREVARETRGYVLVAGEGQRMALGDSISMGFVSDRQMSRPVRELLVADVPIEAIKNAKGKVNTRPMSLPEDTTLGQLLDQRPWLKDDEAPSSQNGQSSGCS